MGLQPYPKFAQPCVRSAPYFLNPRVRRSTTSPPATMNKIRAIQDLNKKEIEQGMCVQPPQPRNIHHKPPNDPHKLTQSTRNSSPNASWHVDYRDTAFVYFGGLPYELSEGDVITIFSQFGEPTFLKLARDKETGKSRGFGWLKYEDQRSTDLAVDNLGGATINGRMISVDHARYKPRDDEDMDECKVDWETLQRREKLAKGGGGGGDEDTDMGEGSEDEDAARSRHRPMLKEERELMLLEQDHDDDDPMKAFLIEEKKKEVDDAMRRAARKKKDGGDKHASRHHRSHRSRRDGSEDDGNPHRHRRRRHGEEDEDRRERSRRDDTPVLMDADEDDNRRERRRRDSRERDDRRTRDRDGRERKRDRDRDRPRHDGDGSEDRSNHRHRTSDRDRSHRHRDRSRSP